MGQVARVPPVLSGPGAADGGYFVAEAGGGYFVAEAVELADVGHRASRPREGAAGGLLRGAIAEREVAILVSALGLARALALSGRWPA